MGGRSGIAALSLCVVPPMKETIDLKSRSASMMKNKGYSQSLVKQKHEKNQGLVAKHGEAVDEFVSW